jgi:uncharacterized protein (UPF0332 family)
VIWRHYLALARGLAGQRFEASRRSAVSRAYYGAFNICRRWLETNVTPIDNRGAHGQVWSTFQVADRATPETRRAWILIGSLGDSLHVLRNEVDYDDRVELNSRSAMQAVANAERIVALLPELELAD